MKNQRIIIASLAVSATAFVGLIMNEGYTDRAVIPVENDRPTVGFGSTFRDNGTAVQLGDTITPPQAVARTMAHIQKDEGRIKQCVTAPLTQGEYDIMVDFSYQYGTRRLCESAIVREANLGNYVASCEGYLQYKKVNGYDCSTPGNKVCSGVWARSKKRYERCMEEQK